MKALPITIIPLLAILAATDAPAQTVDLAKLSCRQFLIGDIVRRDYLALWLSGYYNGKRGNTVLDIGELAKKTDKVEDYCRMNQDATVMDAVTKALSPGQ